MNTNKTNMKELNINEMEQVNGGSKDCGKSQRMNRDNCGNSGIESAAKAVGSAACLLGRVAYNWFTGLFD